MTAEQDPQDTTPQDVAEVIDTGPDSADTKGAARFLGVSTRTVRRLLSVGELAGHKVQGDSALEWRVPWSELQRRKRERAGRTVGRAGPSIRPPRPDTAVMRRLEESTTAMVALAEGLADLSDLREVIAANTEALRGLREELAEERARRQQSWWARLRGRRRA